MSAAPWSAPAVRSRSGASASDHPRGHTGAPAPGAARVVHARARVAAGWSSCCTARPALLHEQHPCPAWGVRMLRCIPVHVAAAEQHDQEHEQHRATDVEATAVAHRSSGPADSASWRVLLPARASARPNSGRREIAYPPPIPRRSPQPPPAPNNKWGWGRERRRRGSRRPAGFRLECTGRCRRHHYRRPAPRTKYTPYVRSPPDLQGGARTGARTGARANPPPWIPHWEGCAL